LKTTSQPLLKANHILADSAVGRQNLSYSHEWLATLHLAANLPDSKPKNSPTAVKIKAEVTPATAKAQ
jgi:hypothetical protein